MTSCGVWPTNRGLVAVIHSADRSHRFAIADTDAARWGLAQRLAAVGADLVVDETLLEADRIAYVALHAGVTVWIAAPPLTASLRSVAGITRRGARPSAALLVRIPAIPWLQSFLRRLEPPDNRQIPLL